MAERIPRDLMKRSPCDECSDAGEVCWCDKFEMAEGIVAMAVDSIASFAAHKAIAKLESRVAFEMAGAIGDAYDDALYALGGRFDTAEFVCRVGYDRGKQ